MYTKLASGSYIRECAAKGKHYVDLCGESEFIAKEVITQYHFQASETGAVIIPSCGFDSVPSYVLREEGNIDTP